MCCDWVCKPVVIFDHHGLTGPGVVVVLVVAGVGPGVVVVLVVAGVGVAGCGNNASTASTSAMIGEPAGNKDRTAALGIPEREGAQYRNAALAMTERRSARQKWQGRKITGSVGLDSLSQLKFRCNRANLNRL